MRIVKEGVIRPKEWQQTCCYCDCVFIWDRNDIVNMWRNTDYLKCPTCDKGLEANYNEEVQG